MASGKKLVAADSFVESKAEMEQILSRFRGRRGDFFLRASDNTNKIFRLCRKYPQLVSCSVPLREGCSWGRYEDRKELYAKQFGNISPLLYLVLAKEENENSLQDIKSFLELHKDILKSEEYLSNNKPLHVACEFIDWVEPGVICLLAKEFPVETGSLRPLLEIVLQKYTDEEIDPYSDGCEPERLKDLNALVSDTFMDDFSKGDDAQDLRRVKAQQLLDIIFEYASGSGVVNTMVNKICSVDLGLFPNDARFVDMDQARGFATLFDTQTLPKIELTLQYDLGDVGALEFAMKSLRNSVKTKELVIKFVGDRYYGNLAGFQALHDSLLCMTSLERLDISFDDRARDTIYFDMTEPVLQLIKDNKVKEIELGMLALPLEPPLFEALKHNTSLKKLQASQEDEDLAYPKLKGLVSVLVDDNTTLQDVYVCDGDTNELDPKGYIKSIEYYTELNKYGRAKARNQTTTAAEVVDLLKELGGMTTYQYGLLRENPTTWCSNANHVSKEIATKKVTQSARKRTHDQI